MAGANSGRPLALRCGAFGDMVLLTALIRVLHAEFRSPVDIVTSGPWSFPLLHGQPGVGEIFSVRSRKTPYWLSLDQQKVVRQLRARGAGPTWYCDGDEAAMPILERAGFASDDIVNVKDHALLPGEHATEQWRRMAQIMPPSIGALAHVDARTAAHAAPRGAAHANITAIAQGCCLEVSEAQRIDLAAWLQRRQLGGEPLILVQIGNKRTMRRGPRRLAVNHKYWPNERWAEVLRFLRQRHSRHAIVLLGAGPEYDLNEELKSLANIAGLHNAADDLPIPRLLALLAAAEGLITVDSGPAHAAAAVGCPQVVLFGRASTSLYRPWGAAGADVEVLTGQIDGEPNMLGIDAVSVKDAWMRLRLRGA